MLALTTPFEVIQTAVIMFGFFLLAAVIAIGIYCCMALDKGRSVLPWGQRQRVERARANKEIAELRGAEEAAELKHMAMQPTRNAITQAIEDDRYA